MAKPEEKQKEVYSILQKQIDNQKQQAETNQLILNEIIDIRNEVVSVKSDMDKSVKAMEAMVIEVKNDIKLYDHEAYEIQQAVYHRSISLANDRYGNDDPDYTKIVGKYRRFMWSKLKHHFQVAKYSHIRRVDFKDAEHFVKKFYPEDYI